MGANDKPLRILYPRGSGAVAGWIKDVQAVCREDIVKLVTWKLVEAGEKVELSKGRLLQVCHVAHADDQPCVAYRIGRWRPVLKEQYRSWESTRIAAYVRQHGRAELEELAFETEVVYSGDTRGLDPDFCRRAQILLHEASLLDEADEDADKGIHSTLKHTLEIAAKAEVRHLVLFHISRRYEKDRIQSLVARAIAEARLRIPVLAIQGAFGLPTD